MVVMLLGQQIASRHVTGWFGHIQQSVRIANEVNHLDVLLSQTQLRLEQMQTDVLLARGNLEAARREVESDLSDLQNLAATTLTLQGRTGRQAIRLVPRFVQQARQTLALMEIDPVGAGEELRRVSATYARLADLIARLNREQERRLLDGAAAAVEEARWLNRLGWVVFAVVALGSGVLTYLIARSIIAPVGRLTRRMDRIAGKQDGGSSAGAGQSDESRRRAWRRRLRAAWTPAGEDEIARLQNSFDAMLAARTQAERQMEAAKEEALLASRAKSEFLANMSHELRTPLNAIIGFAQVIRADTGDQLDPERRRDYVAEVENAALHLLHLINDILDISKIEAGSLTLNEEPFDSAAMVRSCAAMLGERAAHKRITITHDLPRGGAPLYADPLRVKQILLNLLGNALKFTPEGGAVTLRVAVDRVGATWLSVEDTGIGMAEGDIARALQPFAQVTRDHYARDQEGTGLGLALVHSLAQLQEAELRIDSREDAGTHIAVVFPPWRTQQALAAATGS